MNQILSRKGALIVGAIGAGAAAATAAAAVGGGLAAYALMRRRRSLADLSGQVVLITGGSRGLGLEMARQFAELGCRIAICGRDEEQLERARAHLVSRSAGDRRAEVWTHRCDVSDRGQVSELIRDVTAHYGRIDILVANAGIISVGPIESMEIEDFERAMSVMFWGALYPIWEALPQMVGRGAGKIVTITSIGGKISVPHLLPYSCAKFAAVALSEGLRAELKPKGVDVVTIVPGLMRTGSHLNAFFKGKHEREFAWFGVSASTPGLAMDSARAAKQIVTALRRGESERVLTLPAKIAARMHGAFPELTQWVAQIAGQILPSGEDHDQVRGLDAQEHMNSRLFKAVTSFGRSAARANLQV